MEGLLKDYVKLASHNEDLKSEERVLSTALNNLKEIKQLLVEKETEFCSNDSKLRAGTSVKDSLRKRCFNLIDHLVHYKCVVECLSGDILTMASNLIDDDEYIHLSLMFRDAELAILESIKLNQQRNEVFMNMHDETVQSYLAAVESKWCFEHQHRRRLISRLIMDQNQFIVDKTTRNLEQQQKLLNQRYQSINSLIRMSYNHSNDHNNNNNIRATINKS